MPIETIQRTVRRYGAILYVYYRTSLQTEMEYRADFFGRLLASFLDLLTTIGALAITFSYTDTLQGWSFSQAMVLLAVYYLMDGLIEVFIGQNMRQIAAQVRDGTFDFVLMKPANSQFTASLRMLNISRAARIIVGIGLTVHTVFSLSVEIGPVTAVRFAVALAAGMSIVYSIWLFLVTLTFWFVRVDNIEQIVWQAFEAGRYPVEIFPRHLRGFLTYVIPIAFIITVPAQALVGRLGPGSVLTAVMIGSALFALASAFWRVGIRNYTGASA